MAKPRNKRGKRSRGPPPTSPWNNGGQGEEPAISNAQTRIVHAPALGPSLPNLTITYTNEEASIAQWLEDHVTEDVQCLGLDTETKPSFTRAAALASRGPDVLQLAKADGNCLVVHLSQMNARRNPTSDRYSQLFSVLNNRRITKAGVQIDDDCLELHENKNLDVNGRLELKTLVREMKENHIQNHQGNTHVPQSLKDISEYCVPDLVLPKIKRLQMSNWALPLSDDQIGYAAQDAFAGAIVVHTLKKSKNNQHYSIPSLIQSLVQKGVDIALYRAHRERQKKERRKEAHNRKTERNLQNGYVPKKKRARPNQHSSNQHQHNHQYSNRYQHNQQYSNSNPYPQHNQHYSNHYQHNQQYSNHYQHNQHYSNQYHHDYSYAVGRGHDGQSRNNPAAARLPSNEYRYDIDPNPPSKRRRRR